MISCRYLIIGAGFAGAATAYQLARRGAEDVVVVEQEMIPGFHSSGRNAAMIRQCVPDAELLKLTRDGAHFLENLPPDWPEHVKFQVNGSLLLGSGEGWRNLQRDAREAQRAGVGVDLWTPQQAKGHVPALRNAEFEGAAWCATDGVVDIHALLSGYLKAAASHHVTIRYGCAVKSIARLPGGGFEAATTGETIRTTVLVNAGGAWAKMIAELAGAVTVPLRPCRRHLFLSAALSWVDKGWPFVWDVTHDIYFRPEADGLLLCGCDQEELPPGDPPVSSAVQESLAEKIQKYMPGLSEVGIARSWAGLRTLSPDGRFVIGWDPVLDGFFWVAGLGGHGVTTSAAVGALAAELLLAGPATQSAAFSPERFVKKAGA